MQNLYAEGHEIASHTVSHPNGKDFSYNEWSAEVVGKFKYSEVPNKSVTFFILFGDFFLPTWPYLDLHVYLFLGKVAFYTVFYLVNIKKFPPTRPY